MTKAGKASSEEICMARSADSAYMESFEPCLKPPSREEVKKEREARWLSEYERYRNLECHGGC